MLFFVNRKKKIYKKVLKCLWSELKKNFFSRLKKNIQIKNQYLSMYYESEIHISRTLAFL